MCTFNHRYTLRHIPSDSQAGSSVGGVEPLVIWYATHATLFVHLSLPLFTFNASAPRHLSFIYSSFVLYVSSLFLLNGRRSLYM